MRKGGSHACSVTLECYRIVGRRRLLDLCLALMVGSRTLSFNTEPHTTSSFSVFLQLLKRLNVELANQGIAFCMQPDWVKTRSEPKKHGCSLHPVYS